MFTDHPAATPTRVVERAAVDTATFHREVACGFVPVILRGQVAAWPAVAAGRAGVRPLAQYLADRGSDALLDVRIGAPDIGGRFFYSEDLSGFNFTKEKVPLPVLLAELVRLAEAAVAAPNVRPHALYADAAAAPQHMPGWSAANPLDLPPADATPRLWIGNETVVATHYDASPNLACVVAGHRRFTLFPPDQLANLYPGPLDRTIAGPPVSMVDPETPDMARYPRFADALAQAQVAELAPGDALFVPALWWHHVRAFDPLNVLVNYWWAQDATMTPFLAMVHALGSVRDLPPAEKAAWKTWFDHYVFGDTAGDAAAHLPEAARGVLGPGGAERTARIRSYLIAKLQGH